VILLFLVLTDVLLRSVSAGVFFVVVGAVCCTASLPLFLFLLLLVVLRFWFWWGVVLVVPDLFWCCISCIASCSLWSPNNNFMQFQKKKTRN
jgi:hypothetical protein